MSELSTVAVPSYSDSSPRYLQVAQLLRQRIARGQWPIGEKLPSLEALSGTFGMARMSMRQAMDLLIQEGLVSAQRGRGTFVTARPAEPDWLSVETTLDELARAYKHDKPEILNIEEGVANPPLLASDGISAQQYVHMRRVHSRQGEPYSVANLYIDELIFRTQPKKFRQQTVIPLLHSMGKGGVANAHQVLTIGTADMEIASHLKVAVNTPVAQVRRVFTDKKNRVIYLGEITYRGDFIRLQMKLK
jgi:GntR family transcriptional regulator